MTARKPGERAAIDWEAVRRRVESVAHALETGGRLSTEQAREILSRRAEELARPPAASADGATIEVVEVRLADERYGIESREVFAVLPLLELVPLPGAAPPLAGLTPWRGGVLTVLDVRGSLGLPLTALNDLKRVVVLADGRDGVGVLVDSLVGISRVPTGAIGPLPGETGARREYIRGIAGDALLLLDGAALVALHRERRAET